MRKIFTIYREAYRGLPVAIWAISFVAFVNRAGTMVLPFLALYLTRERGFDVVTSGWLIFGYGMGATAGSIGGGWLTDRWGAMKTIHVSLWLGSLAFLAIIPLRSLSAVAAGLIMLAVCSEGFRPAMMSAVSQLAPEPLRPRSYGLLRLAVNVAMGIGPLLGGMLAVISYSWLFVGEAVTCALAAVVFVVATRRGALPEECAVKEEGAGPRSSRSPWLDLPFVALLVVVAVMMTALFQVWNTYALYLREQYALTESQIGLLFGFNGLLIALFEMILVHRLERARPMVVVGFGALLLTLGLGILPLGVGLGSPLLFALMTVCLWTVGEMLSLPFLNVAVAARATRATGRYMGAYMVAFSLAFILAPVIGMSAYDRDPNALWYLVLALGPLLLIASFVVSRLLTRPQPEFDRAA